LVLIFNIFHFLNFDFFFKIRNQGGNMHGLPLPHEPVGAHASYLSCRADSFRNITTLAIFISSTNFGYSVCCFFNNMIWVYVHKLKLHGCCVGHCSLYEVLVICEPCGRWFSSCHRMINCHHSDIFYHFYLYIKIILKMFHAWFTPSTLISFLRCTSSQAVQFS
jgi:hypothetical protein